MSEWADQLIAAASRALEDAASDPITPTTWRALTDSQRLELMALCCHGCGALEPPRCYCKRDE